MTVILKINSETDFSAKGDTFLNFVDNLGVIALESNDINQTFYTQPIIFTYNLYL